MFQLQNIFLKALAVDPNACSHSLDLGVHFELCAVQGMTCCVLCSSYVIFVAFLQWGKENVIHRRTKKQVFVFPKWL
jgi:hypothetical protein